jgi:hypothetical protein
VSVAAITDELILGLDVLRAYDASVDVGRHVLRMGREEMTLWRLGARPRSSRLTLLSDEVIPARRETLVTVRLEATNALVETSLKASREGLYIVRTLVRARQKVPVRIVNIIDQDQILTGGTTTGHCEPVTWAAPVDDIEHQSQATQGLVNNSKRLSSAPSRTSTRQKPRSWRSSLLDSKTSSQQRVGTFGTRIGVII